MNRLALQPLAVSTEDAARASGTTRSSVYEAIGRGDLISFKSGRRRLILVKELEAWVNRMANANTR